MPYTHYASLCFCPVSFACTEQLKYISRALQTTSGPGKKQKKNDAACTELVPYDAEKAAKTAAGIKSDSEESRTVFDVLSESEDGCYFISTCRFYSLLPL